MGADLTGPIWRRVARFSFTGVDYEQTEFYFAAQLPGIGSRPPADPLPGGEHAVAGDHGAVEGDHSIGSRSDAPAGSTMVVEGPIDPVVDISGHTDLERRTLNGHRWWTTQALTETTEMIYPVELAHRLPDVLDTLRNRVTPNAVIDVN